MTQPFLSHLMTQTWQIAGIDNHRRCLRQNLRKESPASCSCAVDTCADQVRDATIVGTFAGCL